MYVEQLPLTVPAPLRKFKRTDCLFGMPSIGLVALDLKAKIVYGMGIIFDKPKSRNFGPSPGCFISPCISSASTRRE